MILFLLDLNIYFVPTLEDRYNIVNEWKLFE